MPTDRSTNEFLDISSITLLIQQARLGCDQSRSRILAKLEPFMISMASRHVDQSLRNKEGVSDVVQQSMLKAFEEFNSFGGASSGELRAWLRVLLINEVRQIQRKWHRQRRDVSKEHSIDNQANTSQQIHQSEYQQNPLARLILREQLAQLERQLKTLGPIQQEIVRLRTHGNLSFAEIAARLDRSSESVSKTWYRTLIQLQKQISKEQEP